MVPTRCVKPGEERPPCAGIQRSFNDWPITFVFRRGLCGLLIKNRGSELGPRRLPVASSPCLAADTGTMPEGDARLGSSRGSTEQGDLTGSVQEKMGYSSPTPSDRRGFWGLGRGGFSGGVAQAKND